MPVVSLITLVLYMCRVNSDTTGLLLWSLVDVCVVGELRSTPLRKDFSDSGGQCGLAVVNMTLIGDM